MSENQSINEKHLEFIEGTIQRLSEKSFQSRAWCITIVSALFAFVFGQTRTENTVYTIKFLIVSLVFLFWNLDSYYLYLERGYRQLYKIVIRKITIQSVDIFDMDIPKSERSFIKYANAFISESLFYGTLIIILVIASSIYGITTP